jgi:hypothetical protein
VPQEVAAELRRVVLRWQQLPLEDATSAVPQVRRVFGELGGAAVPDLGPAVVMDQLTVLVYDACDSGRVDGLGARLAELRHELA